MDVKLELYRGEAQRAIELIVRFWQAHNHETVSKEAAMEDLAAWTAPGHRLYFIRSREETVGFLHLGSRGCEIDWLEDIFVLPEFQRMGIGSAAVRQAEEIVREYSQCLYIEAAARNTAAIRLYRRLGYDCLNTVTVRKDFRPEKYETVSTERLLNLDFEIRQQKERGKQ